MRVQLEPKLLHWNAHAHMCTLACTHTHTRKHTHAHTHKNSTSPLQWHPWSDPGVGPAFAVDGVIQNHWRRSRHRPVRAWCVELVGWTALHTSQLHACVYMCMCVRACVRVYMRVCACVYVYVCYMKLLVTEPIFEPCNVCTNPKSMLGWSMPRDNYWLVSSEFDDSS